MPTYKELDEAYQQGSLVFNEDHTTINNPYNYAEKPLLYKAWDDGYCDAETNYYDLLHEEMMAYEKWNNDTWND